MITTKLRRIGNSKGVLIPKSIVDESGIKDEVQITVKDKVIMITAVSEKKKKKWTDFKRVKKEKADYVQNEFDVTDWTW